MARARYGAAAQLSNQSPQHTGIGASQHEPYRSRAAQLTLSGVRDSCVSILSTANQASLMTTMRIHRGAATLLSLAGSFQHATPPLRRSQRCRCGSAGPAALLEVADQYGFVDEAATLQANRDRTRLLIRREK